MRNSRLRGAAGWKASAGSRSWRASRKRAQVWSPTATRRAPPSNEAAIATGSSVSPQARTSKTSGRGATRGASSSGTSSTGGPSPAPTRQVSRSDTIAS